MALLFLLVLTLLGVSGMHSARQDMRVAGNKRFQEIALNTAEYVLAAAEQDVLRLAADPFTGDVPGDHYYPLTSTDFNPATPLVMERPTDRTWTFAHATVRLPDLDGDGSDSDGDGVADDGSGAYVIQDAGLLTVGGEDVSVSGITRPLPGARMQAFRVSARGTPLHGAQRSIQTVVIREPLATRPE